MDFSTFIAASSSQKRRLSPVRLGPARPEFSCLFFPLSHAHRADAPTESNFHRVLLGFAPGAAISLWRRCRWPRRLLPASGDISHVSRATVSPTLPQLTRPPTPRFRLRLRLPLPLPGKKSKFDAFC